MKRMRRVLAVSALAATTLGGLHACSMPGLQEPYSTEMHEARGLELTLERFNDRHIVVVTTPTGGWRVSLDRTDRNGGVGEAFITARRPGGMATQVLTPYRIETGLPADLPLDVHVRTVESGEAPKGPYASVAFRPEDERE